VAEGPPAGFIVLPDRTVLSVTGAPRLKFLHSILSNDVEGLKPGQGRRAALMDVKGRLLAFVRVLVDADAVRLEVAGDRRDAVERSLVHRGLKHYFLVEFPQEPGALRRFLDEVLGPDDDIVLFE